MYSQKVVLATLSLVCLSGCALAGSHGAPYRAVYNQPHYAQPHYAQPHYALPQETAEAAASAITDIAAAKASAAKIDGVNWDALNQYGHQIGQPLLVKNYGPLTSLYSALAPKRSFVGTIDAGFSKDSYGNIKFRDETAVGAIAI